MKRKYESYKDDTQKNNLFTQETYIGWTEKWTSTSNSHTGHEQHSETTMQHRRVHQISL